MKPMWGLIGFLVLLFSSSSALSIGPCIETDPEYCGTYYERSETEAALAHVYNTFHPQDCATARFFVATGKHLSCGVGCWTHVQSYSLAIALSENRVYVNSGEMLEWWGNRACEHATTYLGCMLKPLSGCPLPENWRDHAVPYEPGHSAQIVYGDLLKMRQYILDHQTTFVPFKLTDQMTKPLSWYRSILVAYSLRPTALFNLLQTHPMEHALFEDHRQAWDSSFAVVFMRGGDKGSEAPISPPSAYLEALLNDVGEEETNVYVGSDSAQMMAEFISLVKHDPRAQNIHLYYLTNELRTASGYWLDLQTTAEHATRIVSTTLVELSIAARGSLFIMDTTSNISRLIDELRKVAGRGDAHLIEPRDGPHFLEVI